MIPTAPTLDDLVQRIERLEERVHSLLQPPRPMGPYSISEFAQRVDRTPYTVREWARLGRIKAERRATGCGPYREWVISHEELVRYQRCGLLPLH